MHDLNSVIGVEHDLGPVGPANNGAVQLDGEALLAQIQHRDQILDR